MADADPKANVTPVHKFREFDDPHYHDDEGDVAEERREPHNQSRFKQPVKRRVPPPRRHYEE